MVRDDLFGDDVTEPQRICDSHIMIPSLLWGTWSYLCYLLLLIVPIFFLLEAVPCSLCLMYSLLMVYPNLLCFALCCQLAHHVLLCALPFCVLPGD
jgi:hypothetical protein